MLVFTRKLGEKVRIHGEILITIEEIFRDRIKISFEAPKEIPIHREEVYQEMISRESTTK